MSFQTRIVLILGSLLTLGFMLKRIRNSKLQIEDSLFWIFFSGLLLVVSIFPAIVFRASELLGIQSPINFMFLLIIFTLVVRLFSLTTKLSQMDEKLKRIAQTAALDGIDSDNKMDGELK